VIKLTISKRENSITAFFFQACVVANNVFGKNEQMYLISKFLTLAFFGVVLLRILYKGKVKLNQILLLPVLFTVYCAATVLWAFNPDHALSQMVTQVQLLALLVATFWAMNDGLTVLDYLKAIYISGIGMAVYALVRYGGLPQYMDSMLEGESMGGEITNRNTFGLVFGNAALSTAYYFVLKKKRIHIVSFAIFTFFAFSSGSRKAMLMIVAGVMFISLLRYGIRQIYRTLIWGAAIVIATIFILRLPYFSVIGGRMEKLLSGEQSGSDRTRLDMIRYGLELFRERPIHGFGIGNFSALYFRNRYSHNNYIELLSGGGLVALVLYYLMFFWPSVGLLLNRKKGERLPDLHLMLWVWLSVEFVFGFAMVQMYNKNSWLFAGVLIAEAVQVGNRKPTLQEKCDETA